MNQNNYISKEQEIILYYNRMVNPMKEINEIYEQC